MNNLDNVENSFKEFYDENTSKEKLSLNDENNFWSNVFLIEEKISKSSDTDKIKYILYQTNEGLNTKEIAEKILKEDSDINIFIRDNLNKYLKRLVDKGDLERDESAKPYTYKLSNTVRLEIDNEINTINQKNKDLALEKKRIEEDKNYMESSLAFWKDYAAKHSFEGKKEFTIDLKNLFNEASFVTFDILKHFFDKPEEQIEFAKISYNSLFGTRPEIIIKGKLEDTKRLKDLRNEKFLISAECQLDYKTDILKFKEIIKYECPSCGEKHTINNNDYFLREKIKPLNICSCGRKGGLKETSFETNNYQKLLISDLEINLLPGEQPVTKNAIIKNSLVNPVHERVLNIGDKIQVIGMLREYTEDDKDSDVKTYFEVLGFEFIDKIDFDNKISEEEKTEFFNLANSGEALNKLSNNLFFNHRGDKVAKQLTTLQMFTGFRKEDRESLHLLLFGEPGTGKSNNFLERINKFYHKTQKVGQNNNTNAGLGVASMKNDFLGKNVIELGAVPKANKGFLLIDELNDINQEVHGNCIEAMESGSVTSNKAGAKGTFPADIKVLATMNPDNELNVFIDDMPLFSQPMGMSGKFVDRFDFVIPFVSNASFEDKIKRRREMKKNKQELEDYFIKKYLLFAENIDPFLRESVADKLDEVALLFGKRDSVLTGRSDDRIIRKFENLVKAVARLHLSATVETLHVKIAGDIYNQYLDLVENFNDKDFLKSSEEFVN